MDFEPIIGLEIHVQPKTKSKMFCRCDTDIFGAKPNTHVCPVCLGLPGTLPTINNKAIEKTILLGLALNCEIANLSKFDRKNYFYPDLPKGYQISQYDKPIGTQGSLKIELKGQTRSKVIRIRRVHIEEDTGKIIHRKNYSLVDFNRCGIPLMEIVTEPDLGSAEEVGQFLRQLQLIIRHLKVSDADMEKGTMRLEPNISVRKLKTQNSKLKPEKEAYPNYKVEIKNINSFKFVEKAIRYEIKRQIDLLKVGEKIKQETRGWNEKKQITVGQRSKEEAHDYRYFPEPDLPPLIIEKAKIAKISQLLIHLPEFKAERYKKVFKLPEKYAKILLENEDVADYIENAVASGMEPIKVADLIINRPELQKVPPEKLKDHIERKKAEVVLDKKIISDIVEKVLAKNPKATYDFKEGKQGAIKFLIGQIMRESKGKAEPKLTAEILRGRLEG